MKRVIEGLEHLLEKGGIKKDIILLVISGIAIVCSLLKFRPFPFDMAWFAIVLCSLPILLEAFIGLVTAFDIKADMLVSLALIASVCIGEDFPQARWRLSCSWAPCWKKSPWRGHGQALKSWCI